MTKIYTKTGDAGETALRGSARVPKNHVRIEACGTVDEANAIIGVVVSNLNDASYRSDLQEIQSKLFEIGASLADPETELTTLTDADVVKMEKNIDSLAENLPPLTHFILPGGTEVAAHIHLARTIVRRAERRAITVNQQQSVAPQTIRYLNRLSDYLFTLARCINQEYGVNEKQWSLSQR